MPKTKDKSAAITSAMKSPERGVSEPPRNRSNSFTTQVMELGLGECCSRVVAVDRQVALYELATMLPDMKETLRNNTAPSVRHARDKTGGQYSIEIGDMRTPAGSMFVVAIVTRTA